MNEFTYVSAVSSHNQLTDMLYLTHFKTKSLKPTISQSVVERSPMPLTLAVLLDHVNRRKTHKYHLKHSLKVCSENYAKTQKVVILFLGGPAQYSPIFQTGPTTTKPGD